MRTAPRAYATGVIHDANVVFAALGVAGQAVAALLLALGLAAAAGLGGPLRALRRAVWGYELWLAFLVAALATGGSLYFSEIAHYVPCELCWYQRICMYPLSLLTLFLAYHGDHRTARYLVPFPIIGAGVSIYHLLIENHVVKTPAQCAVGAGCTVKWINYFGYMTIPTLALTGFALTLSFLLLASVENPDVQEDSAG